MAEPIEPAVEMIQQQLKELDAILKQAEKDMNTMAGSERIAKWKAGALPLIAQQLGRKEAQRFADTRPGPSFTNDLLEELSDEIEVYRNFLVALAERVKRPG